MLVLRKALPTGPATSPTGRTRRRGARGLLAAVVTVLAMVAVALPLANTAVAARGPGQHRGTRAKPAPVVAGQPSRNYVIPSGSLFSYPNRSESERVAIRNRVLFTIQSVWGGRRDALGVPLRSNGTIRMATWSFDDWQVAKALYAAKKRGVSVQVVAAQGPNRQHAPWKWLRKKLGTRLYRHGSPSTMERYSFARQCRGSCRGRLGTSHAKYFLFNNVGARHTRHVTVQTSMNLTRMAYQSQWNQAQVLHSRRVYADYLSVFRQARLARPVAQPYRATALGPVVDYFFPRPWAKAAQDPVMQNLNAVRCTGSRAGSGTGRTNVRVVQYAVYGERGTWIAKKLRSLWNAGCDVAIIYTVSSRPVLRILRSPSGRGAVPMRQSALKDPWGNIVKYNHSKWLTIAGHWARSPAAYVVFSGSANFADLAFNGDEQMQRISSRPEVLRHLAAFRKTWRQRTSRAPNPGGGRSFARSLGGATLDPDSVVPDDVPEEPTFGKGIYRYLPPD